jgi:hypothetical protein
MSSDARPTFRLSGLVSFADLRAFFEGLGFSETAQPTHYVFEHPASGSLLMFRRYRARDFVTPANLAAVRKLLDERGLVPAGEFDNRLHKAPA